MEQGCSQLSKYDLFHRNHILLGPEHEQLVINKCEENRWMLYISKMPTNHSFYSIWWGLIDLLDPQADLIHSGWKRYVERIIPSIHKDQTVYFIQSEIGGPIKIGISVGIPGRLNQIQNMCPFKLKIIHEMPGGKEQEKYLHALFRQFRLHGEWFDDVKPIYNFIERGINEKR